MATGFDKDVLPLFRDVDINCMNAKGVHLGDAQWMCDVSANEDFQDHANARRVYAALSSGSMPPGHRWPQAALTIYSNWMLDGFQP